MNYRPTYEEVAARAGKIRLFLTEGEITMISNGLCDLIKNLNDRLATADSDRRREYIRDEIARVSAVRAHCRKNAEEWSTRYHAIEDRMIREHQRAVRLEAAKKAAETRRAKAIKGIRVKYYQAQPGFKRIAAD